MGDLFGAAPEKVLSIVPNGVEEVFLRSKPVERGPWLVCTATIAKRKRVLELAQAAVKAKTPLWVVGKAYGEEDEYARRFIAFAKEHPKLVRYEGAIGRPAKAGGDFIARRGGLCY